MNVIDLFAGPGGWDVAAHRLGLDPLGVEWDDAACLTRDAAGLRTVQADVAELDPLDYAPCDLLIASPPCQAWSTAGKGGGRRDIDLCVQAVHDLAAGNDTRAGLAAKCEDRRSILVAEPLRWALALKPRLLAWEQVPPVLEMWAVCARILRTNGYSTWAGVLEAERYGVPQTRERAFLLASLDGPVHPPVATHQRYIFGEEQRHDMTLEGDVLPWVSMSEALGWEPGTVALRKPYGAGMVERHGDRAPRPDTAPAGVVTSKARSAEWVALRAGTNRNDVARPSTQPAPTIRFGARMNDVSWVDSRPATTIAGDSRVFQPGGHHEPGQQSQNAVRVSVQEASILQSFPPTYPWQGSRTKQYEQIGNAVPPTMAQAVLGALIRPEGEES